MRPNSFRLPDPQWWAEPGTNGPLIVALGQAGTGAAQFASWRALLPADTGLLAVALPAREAALDEAPITDMASLASAVAEAIAPEITPRSFLFGDCFGAIVMFEALRTLLRERCEPPSGLLVNGQVAPRLVAGALAESDLSTDDIRATLNSLGKTSAEVLENDELLALIRPAIEGDLSAIRSYIYEPAAPLPVEIVVFTNEEDPQRLENLEAWREETSVGFRLARRLVREWDSLGRAVIEIAARTGNIY